MSIKIERWQEYRSFTPVDHTLITIPWDAGRHLSRRQIKDLEVAGQLLERALKTDEMLEAEKAEIAAKGPRHLCELSPDELRDVLTRMGSG